MSNPAFQIDLRPKMLAVPNFCGAVCPVKADMFSRKEAYRGKSQKPLSLGCIRGGNEADEANRQSHRKDGERATGP